MEAPKLMPRVKRIAGVVGVPRRWLRAEGTIDVAALELTIVELPGVVGVACQEGIDSERPEPLAGGLGAPAQLRHPI